MKLNFHLATALAATPADHNSSVAVNCQNTASSSTASAQVTATLTGTAGATVTVTATTSSASSSQRGCPTVTFTSNVCKTCATPDCIQLEPVTQSCDCPSAIPTVFVDYPCESGCGGIGCAVDYVFFTANCTTPTSPLSSSLLPSNSSTGIFANSTTSSSTGTGLGSTNITASGMTITGTSTAHVSATGSAASSSSSIAGALRMQPFWAVWL
ncbi:hypothetical protein VM1G_07784 [Cytospora mali]|uniref:Uncharacterized protein n=1 Tax=Cytospora mali TaxID=578113 RepID=A0A194W749_CYTMA|nr:hypothetical protein VM1G_07784 [Valsa mali]